MKNLVIPIVVVILGLAVGGWYFTSRQTTNDAPVLDKEVMINEKVEAQTKKEEQPITDNTKTNLADILKRGENLWCTYSYSPADKIPGYNEMSGSVYISGDNMRNNYEMLQNTKTITGSMIKKDEYLYVWGSNLPQGIKMKFDGTTAGQTIEDLQKNNPNPDVNPNIEMDYNCQEWNVDAAMFIPPASVTFNDLSEMMKNIPTTPSMGCAVCNSLEGDDKSACLKQMKCEE